MFSNADSDDLPEDNNRPTEEATDVDVDVAQDIQETFDQTFMDDFTEDVTQVGSMPQEESDLLFDQDGTIEDIDEGKGGSAQLSGFEDDDFDDIDDEFAVQAIEANLWDELEDSEEDEIPQSFNSTPTADEDAGPQRSIQSTKTALLAAPNPSDSLEKGNVENTEMHVGNQEDAMVPQMELDDVESDAESDAESDSTSAARVSQTKIDKPKQRLSFSNKVPEVKKVTKREINGLHAFAFIVLFCIIVIVGTWMQVNRDKQEFAGIETNSNVLKPSTEPKEGLRDNTSKDGQGPDSETTQDGTEPGSLDAADPNGDADPSIGEGEFVDPFPQVLPDVPEESFDFANDKSSRELTREGYRALKEGMPDQAIKLFELALEKDASFADAVMGLGKSHQKRGELEQAREAYCRHANLPPESFSKNTMVEDVSISQGIVSQLGLTCDDA